MPEVKVISKRWEREDAHTLDGYNRSDGWRGLKRALRQSPAEIRELIKDSGLRGRGGAGFPTGLKWSFVPQDTGKPVYLVVNADEGEPGTFKDREIMERDPFQLIEGILCSAYALNSPRSFIFLRGEYLWSGIRIEEALAEAYAAGYVGDDVMGSGFSHHITLHYGSGAYICGEETALLEALEGRRGQPRLRPPFPAVAGLYACPTVVNNVESICAVAHIVEHGNTWWKQWGPERSPGTKLFCVSGEVKRPGNYEFPMGTTAREIIYDACGGMLDGRELKFWAPGGSSTPLLTAEHLDVPMDFDSIASAGSLMGTGAMMIYSNKTSVIEATLNWIRFYEHESCGKCTPCREGNFWVGQILERILAGSGRPEDIDTLDELADNIFGRSFCALADGATSSVKSGIKYFRDEYEYVIANGKLPDHIEPHAGVITDNAQTTRPMEQMQVGAGHV